MAHHDEKRSGLIRVVVVSQTTNKHLRCLRGRSPTIVIQNIELSAAVAVAAYKSGVGLKFDLGRASCGFCSQGARRLPWNLLKLQQLRCRPTD